MLGTIVVAALALAPTPPPQDWLVDPSPYQAEVRVTDRAVVLENGLVRRTWRLGPNLACVGLHHLGTGQELLRAVRPEAVVTLDGQRLPVGGLVGQPNHAFLTPAWIEAMTADPAALVLVDRGEGPIEERMAWNPVRHHAPDVAWPPPGRVVWFEFAAGAGGPALDPAVRVRVHHALYDGLPVFGKWLTVHNGSEKTVRLDAFTSELLAVVEHGSSVGGSAERMARPNLHVETDFAFGGGMAAEAAIQHCVRWLPDPEFLTQVHYQRQTPCLLEVGPELGPAQDLAPGDTFESFRTWILLHDSTDRERQGLGVRRMYRTLAPWATENPLMMHVRWSDDETVRAAIDQCAEVGFEMVILTFGSGFNIEDDSDEYLARMKGLADHAREQGIEIGGYSLLASRSIDAANDVVMPEGRKPTFGNSPCLESEWGQAYFAKLYRFYAETGFALLEHDGSYPGDPCASTEHPGHSGWEDSRWNQWTTIRDFYRWCRAEGIYLNVPDWYYLAGATKCGMGYRETNWSLPRAEQVIHTRQNIFDGTWGKTPSMGWMFVPLTQYHGGGEAATIEPLHDHRDHYQDMLESNLAFGVQACYRGPRLFDTDETRDLVRSQVAWYKEHRDLLESDVIHGRRADGRDLDWMLHVNPRLDTQGLLVVFNPLDEEVTRILDVDLHFTGLEHAADLVSADGRTWSVELSRDHHVPIQVTVPARGMTWCTIRRGDDGREDR